MNACIVPVVEGKGDVEAVPALLHRLHGRSGSKSLLRVNPPIRVKSASFLGNADYFRRYVSLAAAKAAQEGGAVMILMDCEDACAGRLGPEILLRAREVRADVRFIVVLAVREYETWFLEAARSLRGRNGIPDDVEPPPAASGIRDAKGWLRARTDPPYDPVSHQLEFTRAISIEEALRDASFARMVSRIRPLFR